MGGYGSSPRGPGIKSEDSGAYAFSNAFNYSISPSAGIPMQRQAIPPAEQQYIAAHPPDADDPT
jgi:hypothetical protein